MINCFNITLNNVGDFYSPPFRYFNLGNNFIDIKSSDLKKTNNELIIIGGGALTGIAKLLELNDVFKSNRVITWGIGGDARASEKKIFDFIEGEDHIGDTWNYCKLISTRIPYEKYFYVPCASCMHRSFDIFKKVIPKNKIGIYSHWKRPITIKGINNHMTNQGTNIDEKLNFISQCHTIITNAYHGLYWSTLLGKKVICIPNKSGLYSLKYKPYYINDETIINEELIDKIENYPYALDECRTLNVEFYRKVKKEFF